MLRNNGDFTFYKIEEYQSKWNRWVGLFNNMYLDKYRFGEHSASGKCWQETGEHGIYDFEYAVKMCNDLNTALKNGKIKIDITEVTKFRIVKCEVSQHQNPLEYSSYSY